jgi:hypothetical protein
MSFWVKGAIFVGGMLASTVGVKILSSKTAKKVYTHTTAAALRCKDGIMEGVTKVREGCDDILADAKEINEEKAAEEEAAEIIEDTAEAAEATEEAKPDEV